MLRRLLRVAPLLSFGLFSAVSSLAHAESLSPITKGPYLQDLGATSVEIRLEVNPPAAATVEISRAEGADAGARADGGSKRVVADEHAESFHVLRVDGLEPKTRYTYRVRVSGASASGELVTAPAPGGAEPFSFLIYGDDRTDAAAHASVVHALTSAPGDFLINTGDYVADGANPYDWQSFFDVETPLLRDRCVFGAVGNHELMDAQATLFLRYLAPVADAKGDGEKPKLYGSYRWSNARFFVLNAMDAFDSGDERAWLEDELSRADKEPGLVWRVVVLHHGPWSSGPHGDNRRMLRANIPSMLVQHGVDLVLAGHDHIYERGYASKLRYVVSGGGGAPLYDIEEREGSSRKALSVHHFVEASVTPDAFQLVAKRDDGSVIDRCGFTKTAAGWDCDPPPPAPPAAPPSAGASDVGPTPRASRCGCTIVGDPGVDTSLAAIPFALAFFVRRRYSRRRCAHVSPPR